MKPATRRRAWPRPTPSCAASSTASSTSTTSRRMCCRPTTATCAWIARSLGLRCDADACALLDRWARCASSSRTEFDALLHDGQAPWRATATAAAAAAAAAPLPIDSEAFARAAAARARASACAAWREQPRDRRRCATRASCAWRGWSARAARRGRATARCTMDAALRFVDWIEPLLRRESYLALLVERPEVQSRLLRLLGLARWPMRYLMRHPGVIDELADERLLHGRFDAADFDADLRGAPRAPGSAPARPTRSRCSTPLRRAHHAEVFRTLVRDVEGHLTVEQVADDLSALADATLDMRARAGAWQHLKQRHRDDAAASPSSPTASSAARSSATAATSTSCSSTTTPTSPTPTARRGLRRLRAQADQLADAAHRGRRAVRHRHRAAAERQLGPAGHLAATLRALPARPRQQHRLDLGAPGDHARALGAPASPSSRRASRPCAARCIERAARRAARCAPRSRAMREKVRAARPVKAGLLRRQAQRRAA